MGIRGLQTFIDQKLGLLTEFELHNCNVLLDGNSIYHQMYKECHLTCLFGGEYDKFYYHCKQLFESFHKCQINVIVVFDGARLDNKKLSTTLERSQKRIDYSIQASVNVDLSPLLLRQTFIHVLEDMNIPYISALGESDDENVSLANHLDCYVIARDSDYYCYNIFKGYIPFDYIDVNPLQKDSYFYLSSRLYTMQSLFNKFKGLNLETLALACCLCGNDYIDENALSVVYSHAVAKVDKSTTGQVSKQQKTKHWYAMQWMSHFTDFDTAIETLLAPIGKISQLKVEKQLRLACQSYLKPTDTLIYRFHSSANKNLLKNEHFVQLAQQYLSKLDLTDEQIQNQIEQPMLDIETKNQNKIPRFLLDSLSDTRLFFAYVDILIHRSFVCGAHIELEREPSIYVIAIPIILPCVAILLHWDREQYDRTIVIYHRVHKQLRGCTYEVNDLEHAIEPDEFVNLTLDERQNYIKKCLQISSILKDPFNYIHPDYHLWLMAMQYWYNTRRPLAVHLYAIIVTLVKSVHLTTSDAFQCEDIQPLTMSINDHRNHTQIDPSVRYKISRKLKDMRKAVFNLKRFDCSIIHEFNCLQTIYMYTVHANEFFGKPFDLKIYPHQFLHGSFYYAFVEKFETKRNLIEAIKSLMQDDNKLMTIIGDLFTVISSVINS